MMLAETVNLDISHNNHTVMIVAFIVPDGVVDDLAGGLLVALCEEKECLGVARR